MTGVQTCALPIFLVRRALAPDIHIKAPPIPAGVPWLTGSAVNIAIGSDASMPLTRMALLLLALIVVSGCLGILQVVIAETLSTAVARDTRDALFRGILRRGRGRSAFSPGDLTARQIGDSIEVGLLVSPGGDLLVEMVSSRSEERRVGKECRSRWSPYH